MDRLLATAFGIKAVELIEQGKTRSRGDLARGQVRSLPLKPVIKIIKKCHQENRCAYPVDPDGFIVKTARSLGIYLGENTTTETAVVPQAVEVLV
jgi:6-phosphofructokinase 1